MVLVRIPILFLSLILLFPKKTIAVDSIETDKALLKRLKFNTQQNSYYDSSSVFQSGNTALNLAKKLKDKSSEAEILIYYGNFYYYSQNFEVAENYFNKAMQIANSVNDQHFLRLSKIRMTYIQSESGNREKSNESFKNLIRESKKENDYTNVIEATNGLAISMEMQLKPQEATKLYFDALRIAEKHQLNYYRAVILNNMGLVKMSNGQLEEALNDFKEAYTTAQKENNLRLAFHALNNVGLSYSEQGNNDEAIKHYRKTLQYAHLINHPRELATAYANTGFSLSKVNLTNEALTYYDSAIAVLRTNKMTYELIKGLLGKSDILIRFKKFTEAEQNINEALELAKFHNDLQTQAFCHLLRHRIHKANRQFESALNEYVRYKEILDSVELIKNKKQINELQIQYKVEKKDNELKAAKARSTILEQENELKRIRIRIVIVISIIVLMLLGAFFYNRNIRNLKKQQEKFSQLLIQNTENERSRIARDLHDDIGQSLSAVKSKIILESSKGSAEMKNLENEISRVIEQTREISRSIYPSYLEKIGLVRSVARLVDKIQSSSSLECSFDMDEKVNQFNLDTQTHLYRIIQECVSNTLKHAQATALKISLHEKGNNFELIYLDNGKGYKKDQDSKGMGFMSMNERARMLAGEMNVSDINGSGFKLLIKFNPNNTTV